MLCCVLLLLGLKLNEAVLRIMLSLLRALRPLSLKRKAFTLPELLIALAILGLIAAFTVPQVLDKINSKQALTMANDAKLLISSAFADYEFANATIPTSFKLDDLATYFPYAKNLSAGGENISIDCPPLGTSFTMGCSGSAPRTASLTAASANYTIYRLKNGAVVVFPKTWTINGSTALHALPFVVDYDGKQTTKSDSVEYWLYANGNVLTQQTLTASTVNSSGTYNPVASADPTYLTLN
jgi:prepilin-type N-terminal cleavage/methylation domain-containing protein